MTLSITTFSITTLSIIDSVAILSIITISLTALSKEEMTASNPKKASLFRDIEKNRLTEQAYQASNSCKI